MAEQGPREFSFKTLSSATQGFHAKNKLGKGGFTKVYKGKLTDGGEIAVKKPLLISDKGKELVLNEMKLLLGGYSALEYMANGHISPKADTYSFGVVVLELISGRKNWNSHNQSPNGQGLRDRANELCKEVKVSEFMDRKLIPSAVHDQLEDVQSYIPSIPSSSCSNSRNGIQIAPNEGPIRATIQKVAAAATEEDEEGIPIPMITKKDPIETMGKLCTRKTSTRQPREKTPLPPPHMTKEVAKKVAKQQQTIEEEADEKGPTTLNDTEEWPVNSTPEDRVVVDKPLHLVLSFHHTINSDIFVYLHYEQIMPEIKVNKEMLAANDAKDDFWQAITNLKSLETSFKKSWNDEGNKSSWCEEGFFEEGEKGKYKDQLTNPQDAIFSNNWEGILRKVGVAEDSLLFSEVPLTGLVEQ
ncbi:G-type lectin S-receptor-like serine/threonine-protein kinase [Camellia lanceoleosa]|uniref:G-type lectin S-receptor-like serine/threonine-protein kinase n=1 Tax=Camellia lanceoleosa TaxID=1840588 RepID=A0ACC0I1N1_9ERIC|nr:G-type lectin S-receptor-like serine/threonine-protein kinase [Camellia lanceoleosa]